jgi:hypothetical protein
MVDVVGMLKYITNLGVENVIIRTIEELANDIHPTCLVTEDPASEGVQFTAGSNYLCDQSQERNCENLMNL